MKTRRGKVLVSRLSFKKMFSFEEDNRDVSLFLGVRWLIDGYDASEVGKEISSLPQKFKNDETLVKKISDFFKIMGGGVGGPDVETIIPLTLNLQAGEATYLFEIRVFGVGKNFDLKKARDILKKRWGEDWGARSLFDV